MYPINNFIYYYFFNIYLFLYFLLSYYAACLHLKQSHNKHIMSKLVFMLSIIIVALHTDTKPEPEQKN